jgi:hypothetical protein
MASGRGARQLLSAANDAAEGGCRQFENTKAQSPTLLPHTRLTVSPALKGTFGSVIAAEKSGRTACPAHVQVAGDPLIVTSRICGRERLT